MGSKGEMKRGNNTGTDKNLFCISKKFFSLPDPVVQGHGSIANMTPKQYL